MQIIHALLTQASRLSFGWYEIKTMIERAIAFQDDALHVLVGVLFQLGIAIAWRRSIGDARPWLIVLALELVNEASDFAFDRWPHDMFPAQIGESLKDVMLTMLLPTVLLTVSRRWPRLFVEGAISDRAPRQT